VAFFSEAGLEAAGPEPKGKPSWEKQADQDLYRYYSIDKAIERQALHLIELQMRANEGRRTTTIYENREGRGNRQHSQWEERIVQEILETEERLEYYRRFKRVMKSAIHTVSQKNPYWQRFIELYWGSHLPKTSARRLVIKELYISRRTFYAWRQGIITKMAEILGYKK